MRKAMLALSLGIALLRTGSAFCYLEDKIYCKVEGEQLTLYVKKEEGLNKCNGYVNAIEQLAREKYDEVTLVLNYISQGDDVIYRKEIFELKKQEFLKLIRYRTTILGMIQEFERKFFVMYQNSLRQTLAPYSQTLQEIKDVLDQQHLVTPHDDKTHRIHQQVSQQILVIQNIFNAASLDEIIQQIPNYLYLRQALEWK